LPLQIKPHSGHPCEVYRGASRWPDSVFGLEHFKDPIEPKRHDRAGALARRLPGGDTCVNALRFAAMILL
jgi:hypothetical protein